MQRVLALGLLSLAVVAHAQTQASTTTRRSTPATATPSAAAKKKTTAARAHLVPVNSKTGARTRSSSARGKKPRAKPSPSYQLHPDPERYQQIQQALAERGYFKGQANGEWSDDSVEALKKFQADQKLDTDGKINALSLMGLGLGPKHDGLSGRGAPVPSPSPDNPVSAPTPSAAQAQTTAPTPP